MEIEQIKNHLRRALVGEKLRYIVRSCELIDFGFGELFRRKNSRGYEREVASYALHLLTEETVTEVTITENGDIDLQLTTLRITAFCTGSDEDEMWRFFEVRTGSPHIVRNGCGYELI